MSKETTSSSAQSCHHQLICYCGKIAATFISQKPRSKGRLFYTCVDSMSGGCKFFMWADEHEVASQGMFPGLMRKIDSLVSENLDLTKKLKDAEHGEKNIAEMTEELKKQMVCMAEEVSMLRQMRLILIIVILLSWAPTIFKWMD